MEKHRCQKMHFKNRMLERFGITVNNDFYRKILHSVTECEPSKYENNKIVAVFREKQTNRTSIYNLYINGDGPHTVVHDNKRNTLVTIF